MHFLICDNIQDDENVSIDISILKTLKVVIACHGGNLYIEWTRIRYLITIITIISYTKEGRSWH